MLKEILLTHFDRYPRMEPQDAVKLVYQQAFGPEHLIADAGRALDMLRQEMDGLPPDAKEPLYEPIGNGLCRLNLRPCKARGIPAEDVCRLFLETADRIQAQQARDGLTPSQRKGLFFQQIRDLQALAEDGDTPFDAIQLDIFLARYPGSCPALHHSESYRAAYRPAYRLVLQKKIKDYLAARRKAKG